MKPDKTSYLGNMKLEMKSKEKSSRLSQSNSISEVSVKRQLSNTGVEYGSEMQIGNKPDNVAYYGDVRSEEKSSRPFSLSNSSICSDD
ncbi:hypothetical protein ACFX19_036420 [Malus domestica]